MGAKILRFAVFVAIALLVSVDLGPTACWPLGKHPNGQHKLMLIVKG